MIDRIITFDEENYDKAIICEYFWATTENAQFLIHDSSCSCCPT